MACDRYEDALIELAAGAAPTAEPPRLGASRVEPELERHLSGCVACRKQLDELRRALALVDSELHQVVAVEPSPDLAARIRRTTAGNAAEPAQRPPWLWPGFAAAAVLLLALVILLRPHTPQSGVATVESRVPRAVATPEPPRPTPSERAATAVPAAVATAPVVPRAQAAALQPHRSISPAEPEVLVPPGEGVALLRLAALVTRQGAVPPVLASVNQASPDLVVPRAIDAESIEIKPLEIVPLDPAETNGTTAEGEGR